MGLPTWQIYKCMPRFMATPLNVSWTYKAEAEAEADRSIFHVHKI